LDVVDGFVIYEDTEGKENKGRREVGKERARMQVGSVPVYRTSVHGLTVTWRGYSSTK
jgi:hypothetical protein